MDLSHGRRGRRGIDSCVLLEAQRNGGLVSKLTGHEAVGKISARTCATQHSNRNIGFVAVIDQMKFQDNERWISLNLNTQIHLYNRVVITCVHAAA